MPFECEVNIPAHLCSQNNFVAIVDLPEGDHQYKFSVDGHWMLDPNGVSLRPAIPSFKETAAPPMMSPPPLSGSRNVQDRGG